MRRLSPPTLARMHSKIGRRQREDQPAGAGVHGLEAQHVASTVVGLAACSGI